MTKDTGAIDEQQEGMTLRDYFAGPALAGMLSDSKTISATKDSSNATAIFSGAAYEHADAMIAERNKE